MLRNTKLLAFLFSLILLLSACSGTQIDESTSPDISKSAESISATESTTLESSTSVVTTENSTTTENPPTTTEKAVNDVSLIPEYSDKAYIPLNNNIPLFTKEEITTTSFESYSDLDYLGRCSVATACLGRDTMPTGDRGEIGMVKPSGWHTVKYDCVDGKYLYNRCHLIGFQLSGENANNKNLITGTRYMNIEGMLPFENMVADYIKETGNHVMYRVTPVFENENLVCKGVQMEGYSVEDDGKGICFNVFCYNAQPSVRIDYGTGESCLIAKTTQSPTTQSTENEASYDFILNINSKKFHSPNCSSVNKMAEKNKKSFNGKRSELINDGYTPCKICEP